MTRTIVPRCVLWTALLLPSAFPLDSMAQSTADAERKKDRDQIAGVMQSFVKSFEARDAKRLASLWTIEGEFENAAGVQVRGRVALEDAFAALIARAPEATAKLRGETVRFLSKDSAIAEGSVVIQRGPTEPTTDADYSALLVRDGGGWLLATMSESSSGEAQIEDLAWLIGQSESTSDRGPGLSISYTWDPNKKFIHAKLQRTEQEMVIAATQMIGIHPATGQFRSWTFEADGGIGEAVWNRDGDSWVLDANITLADGMQISEANIFRKINDDTVTYQSVSRVFDGAPIPDLPPIRVTRVKPQQ